MKGCKFNEKKKRKEISTENQYQGSLTLSTLNTYISYPEDNQFIKGVLWGTKWINLPNNEFTFTINWGNSTKKSILEDGLILEFQEPTTLTRNSVVQCMNDVAEFINIKVRYVDEVNDAILSFNFIPRGKVNYLGYAIPPTPNYRDNRIDQHDDTPGNIFIAYHSSMNFQKGSYNYITIVHELGHAIGLAHPHDTGGNSTIFDGIVSPFGDFGIYNANQQPLTIMTYNDIRSPYTPNTNSTTGFLATFGPIDIVALQYLYGKNTNFNSGNTIYQFPNSISEKFWKTIWDTGGVNTIDASTLNINTVINLNDATLEDNQELAGIPLSYNIYGGITIAKGTKIENIITGTKNDTIIGNEYNNKVTITNGGIDTIDGGEGYDTIIINNNSNDFIIDTNGSSIILKKGDEVNYITLLNCEKIIFNDKEILIRDLLNPSTEPPILTNIFSSIMESGKVPLNSNWKRITFQKKFKEPILIFSDPTFNGSDPCTTQIKNITPTSCYVRLDEPNYLDNKHVTEELSYIIGEKGSWDINGINLQFGKVSMGTSFEQVSFSKSYLSKPIVLTQIQSTNNSDWVLTRTKKINNSNFQVRIQKEEKRKGTSFQNEIVGWMSINSGNYTRGQRVQTKLVSRINHMIKTIRYGSSFSSSPVLLTKVASYTGRDPCNTRIVRNRNFYFQVKILEDKSKDREIRHRNEYIYYFAIL
jgi:serralysin